jgi:hypothetical protein
MRHFLVSQPAPAQILVFGRNDNATVSGKLSIHEDGGRRRTHNFDGVKAGVKNLEHAVRKWRTAESEQIVEPDERQHSILRQDPICTKRRYVRNFQKI